jgi:hypothetical protein
MANDPISAVLQAGASDAFSSPIPNQNSQNPIDSVIDDAVGPEGHTSNPDIDGVNLDEMGEPTYYGVPISEIMEASNVEPEGDDEIPDPGVEYVPTPEEAAAKNQGRATSQKDAAPKSVSKSSSSETEKALKNYDGDDPRILELQAQLQQYKSMVPIQEHINRDPRLAAEIFDVIDKSAQAQAGPPQPTVEKPERPETPRDYNDELAYTDPQSSSWKHRVSVEQYREDLTNYNIALNEARMARLEEDRVQEKRYAEEVRARNEFRRQALSRGASEADAEKFVEFMRKPNVSEDQIWQLFELAEGRAFEGTKKNANVRPPENKIVKDPVQDRAQRLNYPAPAGSGAGNPATGKSFADAIFDSLVTVTNANDAF